MIVTVSVSVALPVSVLTHLQRIGAVVVEIPLIDQGGQRGVDVRLAAGEGQAPPCRWPRR